MLGTASVGLESRPLPQAVVDAGVDTKGGSVFLSFGAQVDGATVEVDSGVSALARVAPGVTLPSGFPVLPGKNVTTDAEAGGPTLGKVRYINQSDVDFNEGVLHVNESLAREYTELYREDPEAVHGAHVDPGGTDFNPDRDLPSFAGRERAEPEFRNRVIGDVDLADSYARFAERTGERIAIRADEGEPFVIGSVDEMGDDVVFHALEHTDVHVGDDVRYGAGAIVHGGGWVVVEGRPDAQTVVGDDVTLGDGSVVFRSTIGNDATIGERSAVVGTELPAGAVVPPDTNVLNGQVFGSVEWWPRSSVRRRGRDRARRRGGTVLGDRGRTGPGAGVDDHDRRRRHGRRHLVDHLGGVLRAAARRGGLERWEVRTLTSEGTSPQIEQLDDGCIELQVAQGIGTTPGDDPARLAAPSDAARLAYQVRGVRADGSVTPWSASVAAGSVG